MSRPSARVVYVGKARCAAEAFPCSTCYAEIGEPCRPVKYLAGPTHQCRHDLAMAIGLRNVPAAPLLTLRETVEELRAVTRKHRVKFPSVEEIVQDRRDDDVDDAPQVSA